MKPLVLMPLTTPLATALCIALLAPAGNALQSPPDRATALMAAGFQMPPPAPPGPMAPQAPSGPIVRPTQPPAPPREPGQPVNVKIEVTLSDQRGTAPATKKTVSMTVADGEGGMVRVVAISDPTKGTARRLPLHVDARPSLLEGNRLRLRMSLEYDLFEEGGNASFPSSEIRESFALILDSGQPLVVAQSADPVTDRRVTIEVKATIMRGTKPTE